MSNRKEIRSAMEEMMTDVMNRGYEHLMHRPQDGKDVHRILDDASSSLQEQMKAFDHVSKEISEAEAEAIYESLSVKAQQRSLELLSTLQQIEKRSHR